MLSLVSPVLVALTLLPAQGPPGVRGEPRLRGSAAAPAGGRARGTVLDRTRGRAFFDRGVSDGFGVGVEVEGLRGAQVLGRCRIDLASDHRSSCKDEGAFLTDDAVRLVAPAAPAAPEAPRTREVRPGQAPVEEVPAALSDGAFTKVAFERRAPSVHLRPRGVEATATAAYALWSSPMSRDASYQRASVEVLVRGPLFAGLRGTVDLAARGWAQRAAGMRFRPDDAAQLYVYEAAVEAREVGQRHAISAGRIRPWHAPGLVMLDGVQAGLHSDSGRFELGVVGGVLPDLYTLAPSGDRWTAGLYGAAAGAPWAALGLRADLRLAAVSARLGPEPEAERGVWAEAEGAAHASYAGRVDLGLGARVGVGGATTVDGVALEALRVDLVARPTASLRLLGGYREHRLGLPELDAARILDGAYDTASRRADGAATWDASPELSVSVVGGFAEALGPAGRGRGWVGPELQLPHLFGARGGLTLGYQEERGWLDGRAGHAQANLVPGDRLSLVLRLSYLEDSAADATARELGTFARGAYALNEWLSVSAVVLARISISDVDASVFAGPYGLLARASLTGNF